MTSLWQNSLMTMWLIFAAMAAAAVLFMVRPLLGGSRALSAGLLLAAVAISVGLYAYVGSPGTPSGAGDPSGTGWELKSQYGHFRTHHGM